MRNAGGNGLTAFATMGSERRFASWYTPSCQLLDTRQNVMPASRAFASQNPTSRGTSWVSRVRMVLSTSSSTLRKSSASRSRSISMREMRAK